MSCLAIKQVRAQKKSDHLGPSVSHQAFYRSLSRHKLNALDTYQLDLEGVDPDEASDAADVEEVRL